MSEYYGINNLSDFFVHYGIKGMKWGIRKKQSSGQILFVSGSSRTQDKNSPYYRRKLPKNVRKVLKSSIKSGDKIVVGDAPGIDRQTQDYLKKKHYKNVEVYSPGTSVRYLANPKWKANMINDKDHEPMSPEWLAKKDIVMTNKSTKGLAVILDEGSKATRNNVQRMIKQKKSMKIFELHNTNKDRIKPLVKGFAHPDDQEIIYWGINDPKKKIGKGWDVNGHNYAVQYRGLVDRRTRNKL
jgi:hypothetical protein